MATIFTRIIEGEIPSVIIHENTYSIVILDISPVNKGHALVISRNEYETILDCPRDEFMQLMDTARQTAEHMKKVLKFDGFNIMINNSPASCQEVPHLHIHIIPRFLEDGKSPKILKDSYSEGEIEEFGKLLAF